MNEQEKAKCIMAYKISGLQPYKCIVDSFEFNGFTRFQDQDEEEDLEQFWNVFWGLANKSTLKVMNKYQKTNHFPGCWHLGRKDNLWINLSKMKRKFPHDYDFIPNTYLLAYDYDRFMINRDQASKNTFWIMKPVAAAQGRGIKLVSKKSKISKKKNYLIMEYIAHPHLINGLKYDLRVYVLVTSYDPLRIYLFNDGLVRFATEQYSLSQKDITKKFVHLTNFSINKKSPSFVKNSNASIDGEGSKWSHKALKKKYDELGINYNFVQEKIKDIIIKTCIAVEPFMLDSNAKSSDHRNSFFELYGFDILIDQDFKPWLLEVNIQASLNSASPLDRKIKTTLLADVLHLIGIPIWEKQKKSKAQVATKNNHSFQRNINDVPLINYSNCQSKLTPDDWNVILTTLEEKERVGNFISIYPDPQNISYYQQFFEFPRYNNKLIEKFYQDGGNWIEKWK